MKMKHFLILLIVISLSGCSSEKSETTSSSDFVYGFETLSYIIYPAYADDPSTHNIIGNIMLLGSGRLSLSDNDQLNLISPADHVIKGKNTTIAYSSDLECCNFGGIDNRTLAEIQDNNTWRVEFKRQGIVEDSFDIKFPAPITIEKPQTLSVSQDQSFTFKIISTHSAGGISVMMDSTCSEANTSTYIEVTEDDEVITVPLDYTAGCIDQEAKVSITYYAGAQVNPTTDLLSATITGTPNLIQNIKLPLKIN